MNTDFETKLNELQAGMVSTCMEYCKQHCDQTFIHIIYERGVLFADFFFRVDGQLIKKGRLNYADKAVDAKQQQSALSLIIKDARGIFKLCEIYNRPIPTELRLVFDNKANKFTADYCYDEFTSESFTDRDVSDKWFNQLKEAE